MKATECDTEHKQTPTVNPHRDTHTPTGREGHTDTGVPRHRDNDRERESQRQLERHRDRTHSQNIFPLPQPQQWFFASLRQLQRSSDIDKDTNI